MSAAVMRQLPQMPPPMPADAASLPDKLQSVDLGRYEQVGCRGSGYSAAARTAMGCCAWRCSGSCRLSASLAGCHLMQGPVMVQTGVLGEGTFGVVLRARDPQSVGGGEIAIKLLPRGDFVSAQFPRARL
jgi:hypothetical protein